MERRDLDVGVPIGHELVDARLHLGGGLVGKREGEDLLRPRLPLLDQVGDPPGYDRRLPRPCPGDDQQRARVMGNGLTLGAIEAIEDPTRHAPRL